MSSGRKGVMSLANVRKEIHGHLYPIKKQPFLLPSFWGLTHNTSSSCFQKYTWLASQSAMTGFLPVTDGSLDPP